MPLTARSSEIFRCKEYRQPHVFLLIISLCRSNRWLLSQCGSTVLKANAHYMNRDYHLLTRDLRQFLYTCMCDVYIEAAKPALTCLDDELEFEATLRTLFICMTTGLKLLHPLMPFITEELHQHLHHVFDIPCKSIVLEDFPSDEEVRKMHANLKCRFIELALVIRK